MSILSNEDIRTASRTERLIQTLDPNKLGGASYELSCSEIYYDLTENSTRIDANQFGRKILIKPKHTIVFITNESLEIPQDMTAHIISKGSLFSIGLSPVSTYADPGFEGKLGLVTTNNSDKYILMDVLQAVAKIHFTKLTKTSTLKYTGQHGYQSKMWVIRTDLQRTYEEVKNDRRMKSEMDEASLILPKHTSLAIDRLASQNRMIFRILALAFFLNAVLFLFIFNKFGIESVAGVAINLISSAIVGWLTFKK
jgi:dCTP deaminase